ncbi:class I SAM-dependent methyltransferase [Ulvibacter litoralis]|uniref:Methyltransferase domain-containing protein n=1 Tax=Ulvibacter litoralis TaxID=227084 RepID=A0A1G7GHN3_9FLAO|nr:class I SAM-dependent methyltransferase [Ulvibacter litoralis]GHC56127.1 SAM-dependent methyltransferase [Ulvibacter litoralis]SDE87668.1 Methyltransferase domain-containing protein [Ulvibacter litoralis]
MQKVFKFFLNLIPRTLLIRLSYVVRPFVAFFLRGTKYTDPIDGNSFRKFLPYGYEKVRENVLSPSTLSLERHRLFWLYLKNETNFFSENLRVLHFAPEQAFYKRFRKMKNLTYTTTDLNSPIADVKADICNLPFKDNSYDFIICNHVLEHIPDDTKAMQELFRVLAPGGTAILQVPYEADRKTTFEDDSITDPKERAAIFGQYDHVRVYGMDYFEKLAEIGFKVEALDYTKTLSNEEIEKFCLAKGELLPVCKKLVH